jgi:transcriptional regulator GlxA family with amidase domain
VRTRSFTVALVLFDEVELLDFAGALQALTQCGRQWNWRPFKIVPVAARAGTVATRNQLRVEVVSDFASCPPPEVVLIPGGYARPASEDAPLVEFVASCARTSELITAVGHGVLVLARAGLADGLEIAAPRELSQPLTECAPSAKLDFERRLVDAGRIITAQGGAASIDLGLAIVSRLLGKKQALGVAQALGHELYEHETLRVDILPPTRAD